MGLHDPGAIADAALGKPSGDAQADSAAWRHDPQEYGVARIDVNTYDVRMPDVLHFTRPMPLVDMDQMLGPDTDRRFLAIRRNAYDKATGITTLTLRGILPDEFRERIQPLLAKQAERERIRALFTR